MMDSEGTRVIFNEHGADRRPSQAASSSPVEGVKEEATTSTSRRASGGAIEENEREKETGQSSTGETSAAAGH